ncbi:hypothetical protein OPW32_23215 [Vibrio europaeus]|uniref:calcium-binding protein n=1 Tax=Vibrio europaeus TaxID=300876 RepID=UPI0023412CD4|nr:hypothetical protein [Vibrio europaeus]MDC5852105.1 hypothetical protein [Vibrio europaeus]
MSSIKVGTTNFDGTGSSANLALEHEILDGIGQAADYDAKISNQSIDVEATGWNAVGEKEVKINGENVDVYAKNFVDADIDLSDSSLGVSVSLLYSKRGQIQTGDGDDTVNVAVQTNNGGWSNLFTVDTGAGNDTVKFFNEANSQFTSVEVMTGEGNDIINLSGLDENANSSVTRKVDAGEGNDVVAGSAGADILDGGAGADIITGLGGNDVIFYDENDIAVFGGDGLDALVVTGNKDTTIGNNFAGFEAIVGEEGTAQDLRVNLQDGLVIALGNDDGDEVSFNQDVSFTAVSQDLTAEQTALLEASGAADTALQAYETVYMGETVTVWSDTELV